MKGPSSSPQLRLRVGCWLDGRHVVRIAEVDCLGRVGREDGQGGFQIKATVS